MCLSLLWIGAAGPSILPIGELCVIVWEAVCAHVCSLPSEHFVDSTLRCQWHIELVRWESPGFPRAVFTPSVYSPKTLSNLLPFSLPLSLALSLYFFLSLCLHPSIFYCVDLSYLLLTSLDLSFQISTFVVVRWRASRQPAFVSFSAGGRIEFLPLVIQSTIFLLEKPEHILFLSFLLS